MRIWERFKTLSAAMPYLKNRKCWQKCHHCGMAWGKISTEFVHMVITMIDNKQETRYLCDNCLNTIQNGEKDDL